MPSQQRLNASLCLSKASHDLRSMETHLVATLADLDCNELPGHVSGAFLRQSHKLRDRLRVLPVQREDVSVGESASAPKDRLFE